VPSSALTPKDVHHYHLFSIAFDLQTIRVNIFIKQHEVANRNKGQEMINTMWVKSFIRHIAANIFEEQ
jgi:hypothetical protein